MIPKIIHYCWLSDDPVPNNLQEYMKSWENKLHGYKFIKWDFNKFDRESSKWVDEAFENKKYAFACDYIRLYAIYNYGGFYMDMDVEVLKSFDDFIEKNYMFAFESDQCNGIEAGCFGAEKNNLFIEKCLNYYNGRSFSLGGGKYDETPLPQIMYNIYKKNGFSFKLLSCDYFTAKSFETGDIKITENTYTIHHFSGSWKTQIEKEIIMNTQKYSRKFGYKIGHNIAEFKIYKKNKGIKFALINVIKKCMKK